MGEDEREERYRQGLPDYHDPTSGFGGVPPARSALTLRLILACFGLVVGVGLAIWALRIDAPVWLVILLGLVALSAAIDIVVVARRKLRGEPG